METKSLTFGIVGFLIGGLVVSVAATQLNSTDGSSSNTDMSMTQMTDDLRGKTGDAFDQAFITSMIDHHQGAIDMADLASRNAKHEEIKMMSKDIVEAQSKEIDMMKRWQQQWGYANDRQSSGMTH